MSAPERGSNRVLNILAAAAAVATILGFLLTVVAWPFGDGGATGPGVSVPQQPQVSFPASLFSMCDPAEISLSRGRGPSGTAVTITGSGFPADEEVDLRFHTFSLPSARTEDDGTFRVSVRIPGSLDAFAPEQFEIIATARGVGCNDSVPFRLTVGG